MNIKDIEIGKLYRLKSCPNYGYIEPIQIFKKGQFDSPDKSRNLVKCKHTVGYDDKCGFIRYFMPSEIVKDKTKYVIEKPKIAR